MPSPSEREKGREQFLFIIFVSSVFKVVDGMWSVHVPMDEPMNFISKVLQRQGSTHFNVIHSIICKAETAQQ